MRGTMNKETKIVIVIGVLAFIGLFWSIHSLTSVVKQDGLKNIVNEIWCGEKGCE